MLRSFDTGWSGTTTPSVDDEPTGPWNPAWVPPGWSGTRVMTLPPASPGAPTFDVAGKDAGGGPTRERYGNDEDAVRGAGSRRKIAKVS